MPPWRGLLGKILRPCGGGSSWYSFYARLRPLPPAAGAPYRRSMVISLKVAQVLLAVTSIMFVMALLSGVYLLVIHTVICLLLAWHLARKAVEN